ncbi:MAG: hypothetical protein GVY36_07655 [Verrucomicrobia bacterium]|nr:hypothetical protein [Verrucomicrobiota bacterium]
MNIILPPTNAPVFQFSSFSVLRPLASVLKNTQVVPVRSAPGLVVALLLGTSFRPQPSDMLTQLYNLKRDRGSGREKPYKPALLLTLIDWIESGVPGENRFPLVA